MRLLAPLIPLAVALLLVVVLDDSPPRADLVFVNQNEAHTLDPQRMSYVHELRLALALYEGLLRWRTDDFSIEPAVAESMPNVSADGLTYTFTIRREARWSNGDPVTAHDFVFSWQRAMLPDTAADYSGLFFVIAGAEEFFRWRAAQTAAFAADRRLGAAGPAPDAPHTIEAERMWEEAIQRFDETVGLEALDNRTLRVQLRRPTPYFLDLLCFGVFSPVHRPTVEGWPDRPGAPSEHGFDWHGADQPSLEERAWVRLNPRTGKIEQRHDWARPGRLVSNGTHVLAQWRYKRDLRLEPNPFYHDPSRIACRTISALTIEDMNTAVLAFESGKVDWLIDVSTGYEADLIAQRAAYLDRHRALYESLLLQGLDDAEATAMLPVPARGERRSVHPVPAFATEFYSFNCRTTLPDGRANPFADAAVRRGFARAVDRQAIVRRATRLNEPTTSTLVPRDTIAGYESPVGLGTDHDRARLELASAGWIIRDDLLVNAHGEPFPVIDLLYSTNLPRSKWVSLELKSQWEHELGVRIELRAQEAKFFKEDLRRGNFMIGRGVWYGDFGDPATFLELCRSSDGNNDRGYANPQVDARLDDAAREVDPIERMRTLASIERFLLEEELPMVPICQPVQVMMYDPARVRGVTRHPRLAQYLSLIEITNE